MPRRKREDAPQTIHHIIQRGNNRNYIYEDTQDKREFLSILSTAIVKYDAVLLQYVLMDNHYHLLIRLGNRPMSDLIWYLNRRYTLYYNKKLCRIGTIYGGRYTSYLITENQRLFSTVRYIVRNPVKAGLSATPAQYPWSGHASVLKKESGIIDRAALLAYFSPEAGLALKRYTECTEYEGWTAKIGFALLTEGKKEKTERLSCLLDRFLSERNLTQKRKMIIAKSPITRELRNSFILLAIADGHAIKDIAIFLHISHETVRRIGKREVPGATDLSRI